MKLLGRVITIFALLIGIYLFLNNGSTTVKLIETIGNSTTNAAKTLQGRG